VVVIGTVPCKIPQDGRLKHPEGTDNGWIGQEARAGGIGQESRRDGGRIEAKRAQIMSASGREIVGPRFSLLTGVGIHEIGHEKGESSQEKCEMKAKKSEWSAGVQGVQVQG
jgi:hypothetical protein